MAEMTYKKGELLFSGDTTTIDAGSGFCAGSFQIQTLIPAEETVIINFNETEYTCEKTTLPGDITGWIYGELTSQGPVFTDYPFAFAISEYEGTPMAGLYTENPGTYSLKIYTAIPDSDSSSEPVTIRSYIDKNLTNLNWNILPQIFESEGVELTEEIERYLRETPKNTNWNIFKDVVKNNSSWITVFKGEIETSRLYSSMGGKLIGGEFPYQNLVIIPTDITNIKLTVNSKVYELPLSSVPAQAGYTGSSAYVLDRYYGSDERLSNEMPDMVYGSLPYGIGCMFVNSQLALSLFINNEIGTYSVKVEIPKV